MTVDWVGGADDSMKLFHVPTFWGLPFFEWVTGRKNEMKQLNNYVSVPSSTGGVKRFRKSTRGDYAKITYLTEYLLSGVKKNLFLEAMYLPS